MDKKNDSTVPAPTWTVPGVPAVQVVVVGDKPHEERVLADPALRVAAMVVAGIIPTLEDDIQRISDRFVEEFQAKNPGMKIEVDHDDLRGKVQKARQDVAANLETQDPLLSDLVDRAARGQIALAPTRPAPARNRMN